MKTILIRQKRKSISLQVIEGDLVVKAPTWVPQSEIQAFITQKQKWIQQRTTTDTTVTFLGKPYEVELREHMKKPVIRDKIFLPKKSPKTALAKLYQAEAKYYLPVRLKEISHLTGITEITKIKITSAKTRWGSRSSSGTIALSWRLMTKRPEIIDYVIIHELCHIRHMNHSASFWAEVASFCPDYKHLRKELKI